MCLTCGEWTRLLLGGLIIGAVVADHQVDLERGLHSRLLSTGLREMFVSPHMPADGVAQEAGTSELREVDFDVVVDWTLNLVSADFSFLERRGPRR